MSAEQYIDWEQFQGDGANQAQTDPPHADWEPASSPSTKPPPKALAWVESVTGQRVRGLTALPGGMSSSVHRLDLSAGADPVVLRRYTLQDWIEREPYIPHDEARTLRMLGGLDLGVRTPALVAADPDGESCDVPAVLMTAVGGRPDINPIDPDRWARALAGCLAGIHAVPVPDGLSAYRRWDRSESPVPSWAVDHDLWRRAKAAVAGSLSEHQPCFLHRDFHPNNVHWESGSICAVVDWLGACVGSAAGDVSHCRWNLAVLAGPETAELFTETYRELTGCRDDLMDYDLATILSGPVGPFPTFAWNALGRNDLTSDSVAIRIEAWLTHVMARAGG